MSVAMLSSIVYGKVSCHILVQCNLYASHVEKSVSGHDALQFVCLTYIWKRCLMSRSIAVCMYYMQKSVPSHLGALQFVCLTYGKCVCYVTIHCMHHIWKMCLLCHNTLQFACITCRNVSHHIWMHCNLYASRMEKVLYHNTLPFVCLTYGKGVCCHNTLQFACIIYRKVSCYVWIHCSLYASHVEKVSVTSQYIAICVPHIWKKCLSCDVYQFACSSIWHYGGGGGGGAMLHHSTLQFACIIYRKVSHHVWIHCSLYPSLMERCALCLAASQFVHLAYGKSVCHVMHSNLHAVLFGMGGSLLHHDTLQFACIRYKKNSCYV